MTSLNASTKISAASATGKATPKLPYVVISLDGIGNANTKPFKNALKAPKNQRKTLFNTFFYVMSATVDGREYWKVGETFDAATYHSKGRYCPFVEYKGVFQILHYGRPLEMLVQAFLRTRGCPLVKNGTEWYALAGGAIADLEAAMRANDAFKAETPNIMIGVEDFPSAFTCGGRTPVDRYLELFRFSYQGRLYRVTPDNIESPIRDIATKQFCVEAEGCEPAAPAVAASKLTASTVIEDDEDDDDSGSDGDDSESDDSDDVEGKFSDSE